jgi:hypothetical protein
MIGLNHALTGAVIGLVVREPVLVAPLALLSHFALDAIPHFGGHPIYKWGDKRFFRIIAADGIACIIIVGLIITLAPQFTIPVLLGVFFAMLPDALLVHYYTKKPLNNWFHNFHLKIQWYEKPPGLLIEGFYLVVIVFLTFLQIGSIPSI